MTRVVGGHVLLLLDSSDDPRPAVVTYRWRLPLRQVRSIACGPEVVPPLFGAPTLVTSMDLVCR
jgi:hypothetical protein